MARVCHHPLLQTALVCCVDRPARLRQPMPALGRLLRSINKAHLHKLLVGCAYNVVTAIADAGVFPALRELELGGTAMLRLPEDGSGTVPLAAAIMASCPLVTDITLGSSCSIANPTDGAEARAEREAVVGQQLVELRRLMAQREAVTGQAPAEVLDAVVCTHTAADGTPFHHARRPGVAQPGTTEPEVRVQCPTCDAFSDCKAFHGATITPCPSCEVMGMGGDDSVGCTDCGGLKCGICGNVPCEDCGLDPCESGRWCCLNAGGSGAGTPPIGAMVCGKCRPACDVCHKLVCWACLPYCQVMGCNAFACIQCGGAYCSECGDSRCPDHVYFLGDNYMPTCESCAISMADYM